ncbi:MAG: 23S rRNA (uracil(1939)-C(5))-methyltransferase RlmD [Gammaproteobacteria bacterium]
MSRRHKRLPAEPITVTIDSLSHEGRGIARIDGKTVFVDTALPGEEVRIRFTRGHARYNEARVVEVLRPSADRITPHCRYFTVCGGCSFQHVDREFQIAHKQKTLLEQLRHIGGVEPEEILPPLTGQLWGYRRRARLGVKYVDGKQKVLIGFREKSSPFIAEISRCETLHPAVGLILEDLGHLIGGLSIVRQVPQIEAAVADNATALVFRHLAEPSPSDLARLREFERDRNIIIFLQAGGPDSIRPLSPDRAVGLVYTLPDYGIDFEFLPTDFIQINQEINQKMVGLALRLLALDQEDEVLELFCGLGNFSLPLAKRCRQVTAMECDSGLIERARRNARRNAIENVIFRVADLAGETLPEELIKYGFHKVLCDPPRTGAADIIRFMSFSVTERVVYVSCNPATFARDAGLLVKDKGYRLHQAGVMDMFPHTAHIESIALFVR